MTAARASASSRCLRLRRDHNTPPIPAAPIRPTLPMTTAVTSAAFVFLPVSPCEAAVPHLRRVRADLGVDRVDGARTRPGAHFVARSHEDEEHTPAGYTSGQNAH